MERIEPGSKDPHDQPRGVEAEKVKPPSRVPLPLPPGAPLPPALPVPLEQKRVKMLK